MATDTTSTPSSPSSGSTLRGSLEQIRDERRVHANTAQRIGSALLALLQLVEQKLDLSRFLRRDTDETAEGHLRVAGGLSTGDGTWGIDGDGRAVLARLQSAAYSSSTQEGFALRDRGDGKWCLDVTDLTVWGKAVFRELEVRRLSHSGGNIYLSGAGSRIAMVEELYDSSQTLTGWRCWLLSGDGTTLTQNLWQTGDQARCQTFGTQSSAPSSTHGYWRLVTAVSTAAVPLSDGSGHTLYDGRLFDWVVLAKDNCAEGSDTPVAGDTIVLDGCQDPTKADRQGVLILEAAGDGTPRIVAYKGVDSYSHEGREVFVLAPDGSRLVSSSFEWVSASGQSIRMVNCRGEWEAGVEYGYYDQVSHGGALWLCTNEDGTCAEPTDGSPFWLKQVYGPEGRPGEDAVAVEVTSDRGNSLLNGEGSRTLTARVLKGAADVTDTIPQVQFSWRRISADSTADTLWNSLHEASGNVLTVTADDVKRSAVFECRVTL